MGLVFFIFISFHLPIDLFGRDSTETLSSSSSDHRNGCLRFISLFYTTWMCVFIFFPFVFFFYTILRVRECICARITCYTSWPGIRENTRVDWQGEGYGVCETTVSPRTARIRHRSIHRAWIQILVNGRCCPAIGHWMGARAFKTRPLHDLSDGFLTALNSRKKNKWSEVGEKYMSIRHNFSARDLWFS